MRYKKGKIPRHIRLANIRFKLWRDPATADKMKSIQQYGTRRAAEIRNNKTLALKEFCKQLPKELDYSDLLEVIKTSLSLTKKNGKEIKVRTLINRLRSKNIFRFDAGLGKWVNLTHTTTSSCTEQTNDPNLQN